ncbi:MAG: heme ABC exporter ATP-binding protein CcmA [Alphaproteobacteria bacterium]
MTDLEGTGLAAHGIASARGGRRLFDGLDFTVAPGGVLLLHGPNGSGKTSLLRLLAGFMEPVDGWLTWNGRAVVEDIQAYQSQLAYVGHLDAVKRSLSVTENVEFWAGLQGADADPLAALGSLGIGHLAALPARFLSAGQRRRLGLARLAVAPKPLWLLDEPTVTLDIASITMVEALIARHRVGGGMVVVASHVTLDLPGAAVLDLGALS